MSYGANDPNGLPLGLPSILSLGLPPLVNPYPALNLDFINNQTLDSRVTFSRGSQATLFDSTGTLIFAPSNVIRNNTMQGAVAGTPGTLPTNWFSSLQSGIAANVIGTGTENGITYIDVQIVGTSGATGNSGVSFESTTGVIAASGQTWAASTYAKIVGGSLTNVNSVRLTIAERTSGGSFLADTQTAIVVGTNALSTQRYETSRTLNQATTARVTSSIVCNVTSGNAIDITLRIGMPQLERGSVATAVNATSGTAYYAPRFDYNPSTLQPLGLLIEESRTNSIRNNTMQGAVAGTPGTLPTNWTSSVAGAASITVIGTGSESGIDYIDVRYQGGAGESGQIVFESATQIVAANAQTWASSIYVKRSAGTVTNMTTNHRLAFRTNVGGIVTFQDSAFVPTTSALNSQRISNVFTATDATTARVTSQIQFASSGAGDITLRIGLPQLELGAFATSVIPTTTTALTRNSDVASMTGTNFSSWYNASEGSFYSEFSIIGNKNSTGSNSQVVLCPNDGTANNRVDLYAQASGVVRYVTVVSGAQQTAHSFATTTPINQFQKTAFALLSGNSAISLNGSSAVVSTNASALPTVNNLLIGNASFGVPYLNGYIRRIAYYPTRLPDATLQALTA